MEHGAGTTKPQQGARARCQRPGVRERRQFHRLQALEDAIAYRRARATAPCRDCIAAEPGQKCDDHARDLELIEEYGHEIERSVLALNAHADATPVRPTLASLALGLRDA
jgi:hypothetical protein